MVYKITYDLSTSQDVLFKTATNIGDFIFVNQTIYINTNEHKKDVLEKLNAVITDDEQIMVTSVNIYEDDYPKQLQNWIERIKYEQEMFALAQIKKERDNYLLVLLDNLEKELDKQLEHKEGSEVVGTE